MNQKSFNEKDISKQFNAQSNVYDQHFENLVSIIDAEVTSHHLTDLLSQFKNPKILDDGGGTGKWSIWLAQKGYDVTLLDISPRSLDVAREKAEKEGLKFPIVEGNAEDIHFEDATFDVILIFGPLIYAPYPGKVLSEANRLLRPGGIILVNYYNCRGWANRLGDLDFRLKVFWADETEFFNPEAKLPEHAHSNRKAAELVTSHGFKVIRTIGYEILKLPLPEKLDLSNPKDKKRFDEIVKAYIEVSTDESCIGMSVIAIICARKNNKNAVNQIESAEL